MPEFTCSGPITIDVRIGAGSVEVHAEPRDTALVEVLPYDDTAAAQEAAEATRVELSGDTLVVASPESGNWLLRRSPRLRLTARVPVSSGGRIRVASADVSCQGDWSQLKLNTASGDVRAERVAGDLSVATASGNVRVTHVGGRLTVTTASGDVAAERVGDSIDAKSASGDLRIDEAGGDVTVRAASGDATIGAARTGTVRATTVSGDVTVGVVAGTGVWLDLNTVSGKTRSDLAMGDAGPGGAGPGGAGPAGHSLTVQVRTVSGDIDLHRVTSPVQDAPPTQDAPRSAG